MNGKYPFQDGDLVHLVGYQVFLLLVTLRLVLEDNTG